MKKTKPLLVAKNLSFSIGDKTIINDINLSAKQGQFISIIGPNGAGKTTLLHLIDGDINPHTGSVVLQNRPITQINRLELARQRAILPQLSHVPFAVKVIDIVSLGREPYRYHTAQNYGNTVINACLSSLEITHLAKQNYHTLSGGEQHRVQIARTLAQIYTNIDYSLQGKILFLDEPTNHLDVRHQYRLMEILKDLQQHGLTIIAVMHDISLALRYAEQIILLKNGKKIGSYTPDSLVASDDLSTVYEMKMRTVWDDIAKRYHICPLPKR
ncbi:MAG: heme ABC transporter ATP-binding protein [Ostreibacterium sp.]